MQGIVIHELGYCRFLIKEHYILILVPIFPMANNYVENVPKSKFYTVLNSVILA
jgi:hypothetical protein